MRKGFTLVELLIVVIIVGILATIAVPQYQKMVNRAKWTECMTLSDSIKTAQALYYAEYGTYSVGTVTSLATLDLPGTANRQFRFSIKTVNLIYGAPSGRENNDDWTGISTSPSFYINLINNQTGYAGGAPGSL